MIALIAPKNPKSDERISQKLEIAPQNLDSRKSRLVAKWLLDDRGHLYCQWVKEF